MSQAATREHVRILEALYQNVPYEVHVWRLVRDQADRIAGWVLIDANPKALETWGASLDAVVGKSNEELFPGSNSTELFLPTVERIFASKHPHEWEEFFPDTGQILRMISIPVGNVFISCGMDVSAYRNLEAELSGTSSALSKSMQRLRIATEAAEIGIWELDLREQQLFWDSSMYRMYGVAPSDASLPYEAWYAGLHPGDVERVTQELQESITSGRMFRSQFRICRKDTEEVRCISAQATVEYDAERHPIRLIGVNIDETDRRRAEEKIERLVYFDTLTGLPNRSLIEDRLGQAIARSASTGQRCAVIFIDLDNFKQINDSMGHALGDELLNLIAKRFEHLVRSDDTVGRFGGDEFVVILNNLSGDVVKAAKSAESFALKLTAAIHQPIVLSTGKQLATASLGISVFLGSEITLHDVLRQADLAMHRAKITGRNTIRFYDAVMEREVLERVALERDLELAIETEQFELHYQPQIAANGRVTGAEALLRWQRQDHGYVAPNDFIPLAENSGQIKRIGPWVVKTALRDLKNRFGPYIDSTFKVAINVSAVEFYGLGFHEIFSATVTASQVDPARLMIELTESALVRTEFDVAEKMRSLKAIGVQFALDDFGTGYSSLTRLKQLPIDELKIDQSFVRDITTDPDSQAIARAVIALAGSMGISVIAEGVETIEQRSMLAEMGCHFYQGYLFSRPLSVDAFVDFLRLNQR